MYQSSTTSQDGLAEAIQLLSCRPSRAYQPTLGQSFAEEQPSNSVSQSVSHIHSIEITLMHSSLCFYLDRILERMKCGQIEMRIDCRA